MSRSRSPRRPSPTNTPTPVDLQLLRLVEAGVGGRGRQRAGGRADVAVAALGARDARLGPPRPPMAAEAVPPGAEFEPVSPLDVPAFLRRQPRDKSGRQGPDRERRPRRRTQASDGSGGRSRAWYTAVYPRHAGAAASERQRPRIAHDRRRHRRVVAGVRTRSGIHEVLATARTRTRRLLAREVGYVRKPHGGRLRVALAFPNTYFVGMSNLGFQTVYRLFNDLDDVVCERVFLPPKQELAEQLASGAPLLTLESQTPVARLRRARVLGVVRVGLHERRSRCCGSPACRVARRARTPHDPLVVDRRRRDVREPRAAGAVRRRDRRRRRRSADPVARCGDSARPTDRDDLLRRLAAERGFYIPSFYDVALRGRRDDRGVRADAGHRRAAGREEGGA